MVSEFVPPVRGGLEFHVVRLADELVARGHEVRIATLTRDPTPSGVPVYSLGGLAHRLPHEDPDRPFALPVPDPVSTVQLHRIITDFAPDVVHAHNWLAGSTRWPVRRGRQVPLVLTLHDYGLICALRSLYDADGRICSGPAPRKCLSCAARAMSPLRSAVLVPTTAVGRRLLHPAAVMAVSTAVRDAVGPHLAVPVEVVTNFVSAEPPLEPLPPGFPAGRFVLYAGDVGAHKGLDDLLDAWELDVPADVSLVVATTRPMSRAVPATVHVTSLTPGQMAAAWRRASVGVVPSRWPDPIPTVVMEAYRAGTPVVVTAVGGLGGMVDDGRTGLVVPPHDPQAISAAVLRILTDDVLRARLARGAAGAIEAYRAENVVDQVVRVYERVARGPVRP